MPSHFLVHAEPAHLRHGDDVRVWARKYNKDSGTFHTESFRARLPHTVVSWEIAHTLAEILVAELRIRHPKLEFRVWKYSKTKSVIHALGPREEREQLRNPPSWKEAKDLFICKKFNELEGKKSVDGDYANLDSPSRMVRWQWPPLQRIDSLGEWMVMPPFPDPVDLETLLSDKAYAFDIEFTPDEIFMSVFTTNTSFGNYILSLVDPGVKTIAWGDFVLANEIPELRRTIADVGKFLDVNQLETRIEILATQEALVERHSALEREFDGLWCFGHNVFNDQRIMRDLPVPFHRGMPRYAPGHKGDKPRITSAKKSREGKGVTDTFYQRLRMLTKGRFGVDTYHYVKNNLPIVQNNGLETHARRAGLPFVKGLDVFGIMGHYARARAGDTRSARILVEYCILDGVSSFILGKYLQRNIAVKAQALQRCTNDVCTTSLPALCEDVEKKLFFRARKTFDDRYPDVHAKFYGHNDTFSIDEEVKGLLGVKDVAPQEGYFERAHVLYPTPFIRALRKIVKSNPHMCLLYEAMRSEQNQDLRFDLARALQEMLAIPVKIMKDALGKSFGKHIPMPEELLEWYNDHVRMHVIDFSFSRRYNLRFDDRHPERFMQSHLWNMNYAVHSTMHGSAHRQGLDAMLGDKGNILNQSRFFLYLSDNVDVSAIEHDDLGVYLGSGPLVSTAKGVAICGVGSPPLMSGISLGRRSSCKFIRNIMSEVVAVAVRDYNNQDAVLSVVQDACGRLEHGQVRREELLTHEDGVLYGMVYEKRAAQRVSAERFLSEGKVAVLWYKQDVLRAFGDIFKVVFAPQYQERMRALANGKDSFQQTLF